MKTIRFLHVPTTLARLAPHVPEKIRAKQQLCPTRPVGRRCCAALIALLLAAAMNGAAQPVITSQPTNQTVLIGGTAGFSVVATGAPPLSYQWVFNTPSNRLPGATNDTLTITNVQTNHAGIYRVIVTNAVGSVQSVSARLTVVTPAMIANQPGVASAVAGESFTLGVTATGTTPLSFQWSFYGQPLSGANSSNLVFPSIQFSNAGAYQVVVTNLYGAATSRVATITLAPPTLFTKITNDPVADTPGYSGGVVWADFDNDGFLD